MNTINKTKGFPYLVNELLANDWLGGRADIKYRRTIIPAANIKETNKTFRVEIAAPGLTKGDFNIELDQNVLSISTNKELDKEGKGVDSKEVNNSKEVFLRNEFNYEAFNRKFSLPKNVDLKSISASYEQGILTILIPKVVPEKPQKRTIDIL